MNTDANGNERELEQWLDATLARRGRVESRPGLENRVLATLQAERDRLAARRRWWWTAGTAAAAATVVIAMLVGVRDRPPVPNRATDNPAMHPQDTTVLRQTDPGQPPLTQHPQVVVKNPQRQAKSAVAANANEPKLDQFPSPVPLTEQERILAQYVQEFPERAVLVARAQTQLRKQDEREMAAPAAGTMGSPGSDQLE